MKCFDVSMKRSSASIPPSPRLLLRLCHRLSMNNNPQELSNLSQEFFVVSLKICCVIHSVIKLVVFLNLFRQNTNLATINYNNDIFVAVFYLLLQKK